MDISLSKGLEIRVLHTLYTLHYDDQNINTYGRMFVPPHGKPWNLIGPIE
jgi:hypothetical protein